MKRINLKFWLAAVPACLIPTVTLAQVDLSVGNAASKYILPAMSTPLKGTWGPGDASLIFRALAMTGNAWFDAIAPYHPTAVGVYSDLGRRPESEGATNYGRNVAMFYASYHVLNSLMPAYRANWVRMMTQAGLDPNDTRVDTVSPIGIGNAAGMAVVAARVNDGMNQLGNEGGCQFHCLPYADYTGYQPVNSPLVLTNAGRWQPLVSSNGRGIFTSQQFVTPQYGRAKAYSYANVSNFTVPPPVASDPGNIAAYTAQANQILAASAGLTDVLKMKAELFDDKYAGFGGAGARAGVVFQLNLDRFVQYYFLTNVAAFDTGIAVWAEKYRYDAVRPISAIAHLYGNSLVTSWGGPGRGTVNNIPGNQWKGYLSTANHPDYPSGSSSFCAAYAQASRRYFGTDTFGWTVRSIAGSSKIEPGVTPASEVLLSFPTWTAWQSDCAQSRVNGGVHFQAAVDVGPLLGHPIADMAYDFVTAHVNGTPVPPGSAVRPGLLRRR